MIAWQTLMLTRTATITQQAPVDRYDGLSVHPPALTLRALSMRADRGERQAERQTDMNGGGRGRNNGMALTTLSTPIRSSASSPLPISPPSPFNPAMTAPYRKEGTGYAASVKAAAMASTGVEGASQRLVELDLAIRRDGGSTGGWTLSDHATFCSLMDQHFPSCKAARRCHTAGAGLMGANPTMPAAAAAAVAVSEMSIRDDDEAKLGMLFRVASLEMGDVEDHMRCHYAWMIDYQDKMMMRTDLLRMIRS